MARESIIRVKSSVELEDLAVHEGAAVLLRCTLATLSVGDVAEIRGEASGLSDELALWCRKEGHRFLGAGSRANTYLIERGTAGPRLISSNRSPEEVADPSWGLAPRGAQVETGGPRFSFTLREKREVWAERLTSIYKQAVANQWSAARDIAWADLPKHPEPLEDAVSQIMTFLTENEFAALYVPARFIPRIHPHYREVVEVLALQIVDEARHAETFTRRAEAGGRGLGISAVSGQLSLQTLLEEPDFTTATFLLCVMGEGTFLTLLKFLETYAPDAVTATLARLAHRDEARHVAFGTEHLRYVLDREPERRSSFVGAVEHRSRMLASISGLNPYVSDALVIYAGGSISPQQIRVGAKRVAGLHRDMDAQRRERLSSLGFSDADATQMSAYHTKNFM
jgi:hypothetical protein